MLCKRQELKLNWALYDRHWKQHLACLLSSVCCSKRTLVKLYQHIIIIYSKNCFIWEIVCITLISNKSRTPTTVGFFYNNDCYFSTNLFDFLWFEIYIAFKMRLVVPPELLWRFCWLGNCIDLKFDIDIKHCMILPKTRTCLFRHVIILNVCII